METDFGYMSFQDEKFSLDDDAIYSPTRMHHPRYINLYTANV